MENGKDAWEEVDGAADATVEEAAADAATADEDRNE